MKMKDKDMIVELMSLMKLVFDPVDSYDNVTGDKLLSKREVRREAMFELKNDYENYKNRGGVFKSLA